METLAFSTIFTLGIGSAWGYFVFLLHNTHAFEEYARALGLTRFFDFEEYHKWNENSDNPKFLYYPAYLGHVYSGFWAHLFGCPLCFSAFSSFWGGVLGAIIFLNPYLVLIGAVVAFVAGFVYLTTKAIYRISE